MNLSRPAPSSVRRPPWLAAAALVVLALGAPAAEALVPEHAQTAVTSTLAKPTPVRGTGSPPGSSSWVTLTTSQQQSLAPLAGTWNTLSPAHQRKWLTLSHNFPKLAPAEQQVLHSRMREWAALSTKQRAQARLNFGEAKELSAAEKKALWEAYQALPPEEKRKLAAGAQPKPPTTAAAIKPVAKQKLASLPDPVPDARSPRIATSPGYEGGGSDPMPGRASDTAAPAAR